MAIDPAREILPDLAIHSFGTNTGFGALLDPAEYSFVTFLCRKDAHYAKALIGSLTYFYPELQVHAVVDMDVSRRDRSQIEATRNVRIHSVGDLLKQHGLPLTGLLAKLNVLFIPDAHKVIVADADSVLVDLVWEKIPAGAVFAALNSRSTSLSDPASRASFDKWQIDLEMASGLCWPISSAEARFVCGSHFFIDVDRFPKELLGELLPLMGWRHDCQTPLRAGDQGFWSFLVNIAPVLKGLQGVFAMDLTPSAIPEHLQRLPQVLSLTWLEAKESKHASFIHYIGFSRRLFRRQHLFPLPLVWASRQYYASHGRGVGMLADDFARISSLVVARVAGAG